MSDGWQLIRALNPKTMFPSLDRPIRLNVVITKRRFCLHELLIGRAETIKSFRKADEFKLMMAVIQFQSILAVLI